MAILKTIFTSTIVAIRYIVFMFMKLCISARTVFIRTVVDENMEKKRVNRLFEELEQLSVTGDNNFLLVFPNGTCSHVSTKNSTAHWFYKTGPGFKDLYRERHTGSKYAEVKQEPNTGELKLVYHNGDNTTSTYKVQVDMKRSDRRYLELRMGAIIKSETHDYNVYAGPGDTKLKKPNFVRIRREDFRIDGPDWFTEFSLFKSDFVCRDSKIALKECSVYHNLDWASLNFLWSSLKISTYGDEMFDQVMFQRRIAN